MANDPSRKPRQGTPTLEGGEAQDSLAGILFTQVRAASVGDASVRQIDLRALIEVARDPVHSAELRRHYLETQDENTRDLLLDAIARALEDRTEIAEQWRANAEFVDRYFARISVAGLIAGVVGVAVGSVAAGTVGVTGGFALIFAGAGGLGLSAWARIRYLARFRDTNRDAMALAHLRERLKAQSSGS